MYVEPCHDFSAVEKIMIFRLSFVYVCITVVDLCMLRILCILGAKLTGLVNGFFLNVFFNLVCHILVEDLLSCSSDIYLQLPFFIIPCLVSVSGMQFTS